MKFQKIDAKLKKIADMLYQLTADFLLKISKAAARPFTHPRSTFDYTSVHCCFIGRAEVSRACCASALTPSSIKGLI